MTEDVRVTVEDREVPATPPEEADVELPLGYGGVEKLRIPEVGDVDTPEEYTCLILLDECTCFLLLDEVALAPAADPIVDEEFKIGYFVDELDTRDE